MFPTGDGRSLRAFASRDGKNWRARGTMIDQRAIRWIGDDGAPTHHLWAPAVTQANGRWYLYYSVGPQNPTPSRIGVAVADRPQGPYSDSGRPLVTGGDGFEAIDPMVFRDPLSGTTYLYAGGSAGAKLRVFVLTPDMASIAREIAVDQPPMFTEGAFLHERDGTYYLSYSHGRWNMPGYAVHYATARSPTGPWTYRGAILTGDAERQSPGHHAFVRDPASGDWLIVYHRWDQPPGPGPFKGKRRVAIERVSYGPDGSILPIAMSTDGEPPRTFTNPLLESGPDPWVTREGDTFYYMHTLGDRLAIWKTRDITRLSAAEPRVIWTPPATGPNAVSIWAPELHRIDGKWYVYYTAAASGQDNDAHRGIFVLENDAADPTTGRWIDRGRIDTAHSGIDGTTFVYRGARYFAYSPYVGPDSVIAIARMANPWTLTGPETIIARPDRDWEKQGGRQILEGPEFLLGPRGDLFLTYSASACWSDDYALGLLRAPAGSDPLDATAWRKSPKPVLAKSPRNNVYAPGHNGFFTTRGGQHWIIYHANPGPDMKCTPKRSPRIQRITWSKDGAPLFAEPASAATPIVAPGAR